MHTHPDECLDRCRHRDVPVVTLPPFSLLENLEPYPTGFYIGPCQRMWTDGNELQVLTVSASVVTQLSRNGLNHGVIEAVEVRLAVVALAKRQIRRLYAVRMEWTTSADWSSCRCGSTIRRTVSPIHQISGTPW